MTCTSWRGGGRGLEMLCARVGESAVVAHRKSASRALRDVVEGVVVGVRVRG